VKTFADLGVDDDVVETLASRGITDPFPIQSLAIPLAIKGHDLIGQARTGTGKTLAFALPILHLVEAGRADGKPQALVVVPTRELAMQVARDIELAGGDRGTRVLVIYGGRAYEPQLEALRKGVDVVVGTPGRLLDLAQQRALDLSAVKILILDEADEMLDLGFLPDVERIVAQVATVRQTMLFSATMPTPVVTLARRYLRHPTHVRAESDDDTLTVPNTAQFVFRAHHLDKPEVLARVMQAEGRELAIVFTRTKRSADRIAADLAERGFAAAAVHGDLGQGARERALRAFRSGKVDILVATDVAARGIDITGVTHVINYECPDDEKTYLHRIGRTGRAGETGCAITFVDWADSYRWGMINKALDLPFPEPEETYSTSDVLYDELDIPREATGRLPKAQRTREGLDAEQLEDVGETGRRQPARSGGSTQTGRGGRDGSRSGGGQRGRDGQREGQRSTAGQPGAAGEGSRDSRPPRRRRRTRGGVSTGEGTRPGAEGSGSSGAAAAGSPSNGSGSDTGTAGTATSSTATSGGGAAGTTGAPRRRRRRRTGSGSSGGSGASNGSGGSGGSGESGSTTTE
jgi:superfamily II DNA/RNA helicase